MTTNYDINAKQHDFYYHVEFEGQDHVLVQTFVMSLMSLEDSS